MNPTLTEKEVIQYVSLSEIENFIKSNRDTGVTPDYINARDIGIIPDEEDKVFWERSDVEELDDKEACDLYCIKEEGAFWLQEFFKAHPFLNRVMFVFDD